MSAARPRPWHNPTPLAGFEPDWAGQFDTFDHWVNFAERALTGVYGSTGQKLPAFCIDAKGRRCHCGKDFETARRDDAFPVRYFWDFRTMPPPPDAGTLYGDHHSEIFDLAHQLISALKNPRTHADPTPALIALYPLGSVARWTTSRKAAPGCDGKVIKHCFPYVRTKKTATGREGAIAVQRLILPGFSLLTIGEVAARMTNDAQVKKP